MFASEGAGTKPLRVLIVRTSAMGDVLHALPAVAAMRRRHPDWYIGWVIDPRWLPLLESETGAEVTTGHPARPIVDCVHAVPTQAWKKHPLRMSTVHGVLALRRELRQAKYDLCVDMQGLIRSSLVGRISGTAGYAGRQNPRESVARWFYKTKVRTTKTHVIDQGCELLAAAIREYEGEEELCGGELTAGDVTLPVDLAAERWVDEFLERMLPKELRTRFAFMAPMAGWGSKQWPKDRYGAVAVRLAEAGYATLVNAYSEEDPTAKQVAEASLGCAVPAPATMTQMIALERRAAVVIAGDTGPLHLGAALGRSVVGLYGPTDPARTGPYCKNSRVLRHSMSVVDHSRREATEEGLQQITVDQVVAAALELLQEAEAKATH